MTNIQPKINENQIRENPSTTGFRKDKKREKATSEYKKSLKEKQTLKRLYGLSEKQMKRYVKESLDQMQRVENVSDELAKRLEKRLDNTVFRMGFALSRRHARQLVSHAYFLVNGKPVNIPSFQVGKNDTIALKETKKKKSMVKNLSVLLKKQAALPWINIDGERLEGKITRDPILKEINLPVEISLVFEFYSR